MPQTQEAPAPVIPPHETQQHAAQSGQVAQVEHAAFDMHETMGTGFEQSEVAFHSQLDRIGRHVPEAAEQLELITRGASQLIEAFGVKPEFFDDDNRSTIFTSLALKTTRIEDKISSGAGSADRQEIIRQQAFVASATFLLTRHYSEKYPDLAAKHENQASGGNGDIKKAVIDRFEQPELTRSLREYIEREGVLDGLRAKFEGVGGDEPVYHVLSVGKYEKYAAEHFDFEGSGVTKEEVEKWSEGLYENAQRFAELVPSGALAANASGFAAKFDDVPGHHVYIPAPSAELMMAEERGIVPNKIMRQFKPKKRTEGTIKHEFVHTRNGLIVEEELGVSVEERRAEYFADDPGEYFEIKDFFAQLRVLHGHSVINIFEEALQSSHTTDPVGTYELLGKYYGLETVAEIAASQPLFYIRHTKSEFTKEMIESVGGFNAIIERDANSSYVDKDAARGRLIIAVNGLRSIKAKDGVPDPGYDQYLEKQFYGPVFRALSMKIADISYEAPQAA